VRRKEAKKSMDHKFRFGVQLSRAHSGEDWVEKARRIEDLGFSTLLMPDHFDNQFAPLTALAAAAASTSALRVGGLVLDNDFRHPLVLAKELATLDVLSGGRLEVGLGAGWMISDYEQSGIAYELAGVRIARLQEAVSVIKSCLRGEPFSFAGHYYRITNHQGIPKPVQSPYPPLMLAGGARRVLSFAAKEADIVAVNFSLAAGRASPQVTATGTPAATAEKIGWIRAAAGDRFEQLELNTTVFFTVVTEDRQETAERLAAGFGLQPADLLGSPHAAIGTVEEIADDLVRNREEYGFSYIVFQGSVFEAVAPVVRQLAGR